MTGAEGDSIADDDNEEYDDRAWVVQEDPPTWKSFATRKEVNPEDVGEPDKDSGSHTLSGFTVSATQSQHHQDRKWGLTQQRIKLIKQTDETRLRTVVTPTKDEYNRKLELKAVRLGQFIECTIDRCKNLVRYLDPAPICQPCWTWVIRYRKKHDGATPTLDEIANRPRRRPRKQS